MLNQQDKKIKELQQQLVEKEADIVALDTDNYSFKQHIDNLRNQLAEKEKEIENLNNRILISQLQAPEEQRLKIIGSSCCQYNPKRDKISFAVEQLEKVKELLLSKAIQITGTSVDGVRLYSINEIFSNQINELKGKVEDEKRN